MESQTTSSFSLSPISEGISQSLHLKEEEEEEGEEQSNEEEEEEEVKRIEIFRVVLNILSVILSIGSADRPIAEEETIKQMLSPLQRISFQEHLSKHLSNDDEEPPLTELANDLARIIIHRQLKATTALKEEDDSSRQLDSKGCYLTCLEKLRLLQTSSPSDSMPPAVAKAYQLHSIARCLILMEEHNQVKLQVN